MKRKIYPSEAQEQAALFQWAKMVKIPGTHIFIDEKMFAIANGGSRHLLEAVNLKKQGVKRGVPDVCFAYPFGGYHGMFIEMKKTNGGTLTVDQKDWLSSLTQDGYFAVISHGFDEAKLHIVSYLNMGDF